MEKLLLRKAAILWVNEYYDEESYVLLKVFRKDLTESYDILIDKSYFKKVSEGQWFGCIGRKNTHLKDILCILWTKSIKGKKQNFQIYQWILDTKDKEIIIDHKNTNRLDNRRQNLRISNPVENAVNQSCNGYNLDAPTGRYLTRVTCGGKAINIGRYDTELEAETVFLKAYIIMGYDKVSQYHRDRINELNVILKEEDYSNKYLKKIYNIVNNTNIYVENGKFNYTYDENMDIIIDLIDEKYSWNKIAIHLRENIKGLEGAKGETVHKKYLKYIEQIKPFMQSI